jgi:hypothetical protein
MPGNQINQSGGKNKMIIFRGADYPDFKRSRIEGDARAVINRHNISEQAFIAGGKARWNGSY